jgi:hypothetical protein
MNHPTKFAKKTLALILLAFAVSLKTYAIPFCGTITETIVSTNDSAFYVGQTFVGCYQYDSPTVDGLFGRPDFRHDSALNTLNMLIYNWSPHVTGAVSAANAGGSDCFLTVSGGSVTGFSYDGERAFGEFWFSTSTFAWAGYFPSETGIATWGSISFSGPVAVPEGAASTAGLLLFSVLGLVVFRRKFAA